MRDTFFQEDGRNDGQATAERTVAAILDRVDGGADFPLATTPLDACPTWRTERTSPHDAVSRRPRAHLALPRYLAVRDDRPPRRMRVVARTLRKERESVPTWWRRGSTSAIPEGLSSVIKSVRMAARGVREHRVL